MKVTVQGYLDDKLKKAVSPEAKIHLLTEWYKNMQKYIPFVTGVLMSGMRISETPLTEAEAAEIMQREGIREDGIHFAAEYAGRLYYGDGFNFTKDQHPLAQARWGDVAWELDGEKIMNDFKQYIITKEE